MWRRGLKEIKRLQSEQTEVMLVVSDMQEKQEALADENKQLQAALCKITGKFEQVVNEFRNALRHMPQRGIDPNNFSPSPSVASTATPDAKAPGLGDLLHESELAQTRAQAEVARTLQHYGQRPDTFEEAWLKLAGYSDKAAASWTMPAASPHTPLNAGFDMDGIAQALLLNSYSTPAASSAPSPLGANARNGATFSGLESSGFGASMGTGCTDNGELDRVLAEVAAPPASWGRLRPEAEEFVPASALPAIESKSLAESLDKEATASDAGGAAGSSGASATSATASVGTAERGKDGGLAAFLFP